MKKIARLGFVFASIVPSFAFAAAATFFDIMATGLKILNYIIPILMTLAVVYFIWGVIQYTISGDEEAKSKARSGIITGLIGLFVIISFWGIVAVIQETTGISGATIEVDKLPKVNFE